MSHYLFVLLSDFSGTGLLSIAFAGALGLLLIWDARESRPATNQRTLHRPANQRATNRSL